MLEPEQRERLHALAKRLGGQDERDINAMFDEQRRLIKVASDEIDGRTLRNNRVRQERRKPKKPP